MTFDPTTVTTDHIVGKASELKAQGYRLVTMTCTDLDEKQFDILYHFDKDTELTNLRMIIEKGTNPPSISSVYFSAFLIENEMRDQFGISFDGLVLDFGGTLYLEEEAKRTPFCRYSVIENKSGETEA